jgi:hypothetical protein
VEFHMARREELVELVGKTRPYSVKYLYRYRSMKSRELPPIFEHRKVYLTDPTTFNDPFECRPNLTVHKGSFARELYLKERAKDRFPTADKKTIKETVSKAKRKLQNNGLLENMYEAFLRKTGVYCLSEKNDDILMWSHYTDGHKGLCLIFDASQEDTIFWEATKVIYQEEYPIVNVMDIGRPEEFRKAVLTKSSHWRYEQEWRILRFEREGGPGWHIFAPELLKGVILGALIQSDDKNKILRWKEGYPNKIDVYQANISRTKYQLDMELIK